MLPLRCCLIFWLLTFSSFLVTDKIVTTQSCAAFFGTRTVMVLLMISCSSPAVRMWMWQTSSTPCHRQQSPLAVPAAPVPSPAASKRGKADASVTVPSLGVISVYDQYKLMKFNCKTHSKWSEMSSCERQKCGQRSRPRLRHAMAALEW